MRHWLMVMGVVVQAAAGHVIAAAVPNATMPATQPAANAVPLKLEYKQLLHTHAADAARLLNAMFKPMILDDAGDANRGQGVALTPRRLYADSDARTNTVVMNGPPEQVALALGLLEKIEAIPEDQLKGGVFFIKRVKHMKPDDMVAALNRTVGAEKGQPDARGGRDGAATRALFVANPGTDAILVFTDRTAEEAVRQAIDDLDQPAEKGETGPQPATRPSLR